MMDAVLLIPISVPDHGAVAVIATVFVSR